MNISLKKIPVYIDVAFCLVVLPLVLSIIPLERMFANSRVFTVILIVFLYATYFLYRKMKVPSLIMRKKYLKAFLFLASLLVVTSLLAHFPLTDDLIMSLPEIDIPRVSAHRTQRVWFLFLVVSGFSLSIDLTFELFRQVIARKEVEDARNRAELSVYKAQINPHFLFNSLNTIYGMIVNRSEKTEEAFVRFTDMLKYMYNNSVEDNISIGTELEYIGNYIEFQNLRNNGRTKVEWNSVIDDPSVRIPSMLLITFVENAFKYGASSSRDCVIRISARLENRVLVFETENRIMRRPEDDRKGIGLENSRNRLELLFPERYVLDLHEEQDTFTLKLEIRL